MEGGEKKKKNVKSWDDWKPAVTAKFLVPPAEEYICHFKAISNVKKEKKKNSHQNSP